MKNFLRTEILPCFGLKVSKNFVGRLVYVFINNSRFYEEWTQGCKDDGTVVNEDNLFVILNEATNLTITGWVKELLALACKSHSVNAIGEDVSTQRLMRCPWQSRWIERYFTTGYNLGMWRHLRKLCIQHSVISSPYWLQRTSPATTAQGARPIPCFQKGLQSSASSTRIVILKLVQNSTFRRRERWTVRYISAVTMSRTMSIAGFNLSSWPRKGISLTKYRSRR